jgi:hypothetical protein
MSRAAQGGQGKYNNDCRVHRDRSKRSLRSGVAVAGIVALTFGNVNTF